MAANLGPWSKTGSRTACSRDSSCIIQIVLIHKFTDWQKTLNNSVRILHQLFFHINIHSRITSINPVHYTRSPVCQVQEPNWTSLQLTDTALLSLPWSRTAWSIYGILKWCNKFRIRKVKGHLGMKTRLTSGRYFSCIFSWRVAFRLSHCTLISENRTGFNAQVYQLPAASRRADCSWWRASHTVPDVERHLSVAGDSKLWTPIAIQIWCCLGLQEGTSFFLAG